MTSDISNQKASQIVDNTITMNVGFENYHIFWFSVQCLKIYIMFLETWSCMFPITLCKEGATFAVDELKPDFNGKFYRQVAWFYSQ